jgi:hypothetical protein
MTDEEPQFSPVLEDFLKSRNIPGIRIPESAKRTPDYLISLPKRNVLLELKIKSDNPAQIEESHAIMASGGIGSRSKALSPTNTVSGVISDGAKQMIEYDPESLCHHVLWLHASGYDATAHWEQLVSTLYGTQRLFSKERPELIHCFFFHNSAFWRYKQTLAAAFVSDWNSDGDLTLQLRLNPHYLRKSEFLTSELCEALHDCLYEVDKFVDGVQVLLMDGECDRRDSRGVLEYLQAKYKLAHLQTFDMGYQYAGMWVQPDESLEEP